MVSTIALGADHAGYGLKEALKAWLINHGYQVLDLGTHSTESVDYPDYAALVAESLADHKVEDPEDEVKVGDEIQVKILRVDTLDRKIGLSRKLDAPIEPMESQPGSSRDELKGGMGDSSGPLFTMGGSDDDE